MFAHRADARFTDGDLSGVASQVTHNGIGLFEVCLAVHHPVFGH